MTPATTPPMQRYTTVAIALHWLIAAVILSTALLGVYMHELPLSPFKLKLYSYHKWIGVTIFLLVLIRLAWRLAHRPPPPPPSMPAWQHRAAQAAHVLLYVLTLIIPISGWLMSSASGSHGKYAIQQGIIHIYIQYLGTAFYLLARHT